MIPVPASSDHINPTYPKKESPLENSSHYKLSRSSDLRARITTFGLKEGCRQSNHASCSGKSLVEETANEASQREEELSLHCDLEYQMHLDKIESLKNKSSILAVTESLMNSNSISGV
jgi:hypothetical protein